MQSNEDTRLNQQAPEEASAAVADPPKRKPGRPKGSTNVGKKKSSKKKVSKKKVASKAPTEPIAGDRVTGTKAAKKKTSKKKRGKKKVATSGAGASDSMARLMAAVEELRDAAVELAHSKAAEQHTAVQELRQAAKAKIADLEDIAVRSLKKLGL